MIGAPIPKKGVTITSALGSVIRLTPKTLSLNGKRRGYIDPTFDYVSALVYKKVTTMGTATFRHQNVRLPFTTGANGAGRRIWQFIRAQGSVDVPGITPPEPSSHK